MDNHLSDRLREAEVKLEVPSIAVLEDATGGLLKQLSLADVPELLRLACGKPLRTDYESRFREHYRASDELFPLRDENHYVAVLATNALVQLFHHDTPIAVFGALASRCARFAGWKSPHPDLYKSADTQVHRAGTTRHPAKEPQRLSPRQAAVNKALETVSTTPDLASASAAITELGGEVHRLRTYSSSIGPFAIDLVEGLSEQVRMLWWLLSGWSELAYRRLDEIPNDAAPIVAAAELARLTGKEPGPASASALLQQALLVAGLALEDQVSLNKSLESLSKMELVLPSTHESVRDITTVLSAISTSAVADAHSSVEAVVLAREVYDELILSSVASREWPGA